MFNPIKVFIPLAIANEILGAIKVVYDVLGLFIRTPNPSWQLIFQPVLSTSAVLLLFVGLQFLMIGMVADGVIRRIAQHNKPLEPSYGIETFTQISNTDISNNEIKVDVDDL